MNKPFTLEENYGDRDIKHSESLVWYVHKNDVSGQKRPRAKSANHGGKRYTKPLPQGSTDLGYIHPTPVAYMRPQAWDYDTGAQNQQKRPCTEDAELTMSPLNTHDSANSGVQIGRQICDEPSPEQEDHLIQESPNSCLTNETEDKESTIPEDDESNIKNIEEPQRDIEDRRQEGGSQLLHNSLSSETPADVAIPDGNADFERALQDDGKHLCNGKEADAVPVTAQMQDAMVTRSATYSKDDARYEPRTRKITYAVALLLLLAFLSAVLALALMLGLYMENDCTDTFCKNGGSCVDKFNDKTCYCRDGFRGNSCEENIDECSSNPCFNGATCVDDIDEFSCVCSPGYTDTFCDVEINECASSPCLHFSHCTESIDRFDCDCREGYTGVVCETDIDECGSSPCLFGSCFEEARSDGYLCVCDAGYTGVHCEENINECESSPCEGHSECVDRVDEFFCVCEDGLFGESCAYRYSYLYECCSDPCENGGFCNQGDSAYVCECNAGYTGIQCETDIDECASRPCQNGATCHNLVNGYECSCPPGYEGTNCQSDIDECASGPCQNGAPCHNLVNGYECSCSLGSEGTNCQSDIDECASGPCQNGAPCHNLVNGYECSCSLGSEGTNCQYNTNDIVLVMDATASMVHYMNEVYDLMSAIVNDLTIGESTSRVALVSHNNAAQIHWDFTSPIAYDSERILTGLAGIVYSASGTRPINAFRLARDIFQAQNREFSKNYIVYVSDGHESTDDSDWIRNTLGASPDGAESARIILIGTVQPGSGWNNLIMFNNNPSDRFDFGMDNVPQSVVNIIQS